MKQLVEMMLDLGERINTDDWSYNLQEEFKYLLFSLGKFLNQLNAEEE